MMTRRSQSERGGPPAIGVGFGIDFRAGVQQHLRDLDNVLGSLLPEVLDAIRGNVMEQSGAMLAGRTHSYQSRIIAQQPFEPLDITVDDRVCR
jgi:hypothetical protein